MKKNNLDSSTVLARSDRKSKQKRGNAPSYANEAQSIQHRCPTGMDGSHSSRTPNGPRRASQSRRSRVERDMAYQRRSNERLDRKRQKRGIPSSEEFIAEHRNETLAVIEDIDNGHEFYVTMVDKFEFFGRQYVAMSVFDPEATSKDEPEFVLMRFDTDENGEHFYQSIRNKSELDSVFDHFFDRYVHELGL